MKKVLFVLLFAALLLAYIGDGQNAFVASDFEDLIRSVSRGLSEVTNFKDVAKDLIFLDDAANMIAALPVK